MEERFTQNLIDQVKEAQIKLGYAKETVRLYYPVESLNALTGADAKSPEEMLEILEREFDRLPCPADAAGDPADQACASGGAAGACLPGRLTFAVSAGRVEVSIPPEMAEYIHLHTETPPFLAELVELFRHGHGLTRDSILALFRKYDPAYTMEQMPEGSDFDYVLYFENGQPDGWYYCIKEEMGHTIYHRFAKEDYLRLLQ